MMSHVSDDTFPFKSTDSIEEKPKKRWHAHWDCFSGAAGDMMLAACLDAASNNSNSSSSSSSSSSSNSSSSSSVTMSESSTTELLQQIENSIRNGLPDLANEFRIDCQRVWRGSGSITAMHVVVHSVYGHQPVPVPIRSMRDEVTTSAVNAAPPSSHHVHDHQHDHEHQHCIHTRHNLSQTTIQDDEPIDDEISRSCGATFDHSHSHTHATAATNGIDHHVRNLPQIRQMLLDASEEHIPKWVRENAIAAFTELAMAEATVHGANSIDDVHFHEVGAVDSIVDTVGTLLALHYLGVTSVSCSRLPLGEGMVTTDHGVLPVPAPATLLLMVGMPTTPGPPGRTGELVTPTAASMLRVLCKNPTDGRSPCMTLRKVGIGAGSKDFKGHPNIVRLLLGECV